MRTKLSLLAALAAVVAALAAGVAGAAGVAAGGATAGKASAADLRVTLDSLLGEHAILAIHTLERAYSGGKDFPAMAAALDRNSVAISKAIGSVYGKQAGDKFLNGQLLWRDHIRFFAAYTVAKAKNDKMGMQDAVGKLRGYTEAASAFFSGATGLPQAALRKGLTVHLNQLKGAVDAYAAGNYTRANVLTERAYDHMIMTGDLLAGAIAKKFPQRFA